MNYQKFARCLSVMTKRRVSALVTTSVLSVGCSASAVVCRADGLQEAREKAASIINAILQSFIVFILLMIFVINGCFVTFLGYHPHRWSPLPKRDLCI